jgi:hypothetical protein
MVAIQQGSLFGNKSVAIGVKEQKAKAQPAARSAFPHLSLNDGHENAQLRAEAVFWHRLIIGQMIRNFGDPKARRKMARGVLSEMKIKQGRLTPEILMRDMLLMKNLG